jgi:hypothetical protein
MSDNEPDGIKNATYTTLPKKLATEIKNVRLFCIFYFNWLIITREIPCLFNKMEDKSKKTKRSRGNNFWKNEELLLLQSIAPITRGTLAIWYIFSALLCISSIFSYMLT